MIVTIVVDNLRWGGAHAANAVKNILSQDYVVTVTDIAGFETFKCFHDSDLVFAWIDSANEVIYDKLKKGAKFVFVSRIPGWKAVYRAARQPHELSNSITGIVACNWELAETARKLYPKAIVRCIPNGVDENHFCPTEHLGSGWGWVGRFQDDQKDVALLEDIKNAYRPREIKVMRQLWKEGQIVAVKWPEEMRQWYQRLYGFFQTSRFEGSSNALLEACACGLPIVATPAGVAYKLLQPVYLCTNSKHFNSVIDAFNSDGQLAKNVGLANRRTILRSWCWHHRKVDYANFLEACLS